MWGRYYIMGRGEAWSVRVTAPCHGDGSASWRRLTWSPGHQCHCVTRDHSSGHTCDTWHQSCARGKNSAGFWQRGTMTEYCWGHSSVPAHEAKQGMLTTENLEYIDPVECCGNELTSLLHGSSPLVNLDWGLSNWEISNIQSPKTRAGGYSCLYGQP